MHDRASVLVLLSAFCTVVFTKHSPSYTRIYKGNEFVYIGNNAEIIMDFVYFLRSVGVDGIYDNWLLSK